MVSSITNSQVSAGTDLKVLVIEPYPLMRRALVDEISRAEGVDVVGEAGDSRTAARIARTIPVDIVVTEAHLESENAGVALCARMKKLPTSPLVVVHTSDNSPRAVADCLAVGADSFVHKSFEPETLIDSMRRTARLHRPWILGRESAALPGTRPVGTALTTREQEVLGLLLMRLTNDEIAVRLHLARQTVKNYVSSVMRKLEVSTRRDLFTRAAHRLDDLASGRDGRGTVGA